MPKKPQARSSAGKKKKVQKAQTDEAQSERFIATARSLEVDESGKTFDRTLAKIVPANIGKNKR